MGEREHAQARAELRGLQAPGQPCAFHDQSMELLRAAIQDLRDQMRQALEAVTAQSRANGKTLARIADSQVARRELCARQAERLGALERGGEQHHEAHMAEREEYLAERADLWAAVNKLRFHVYVGLGVGLVLQALAPLGYRILTR